MMLIFLVLILGIFSQEILTDGEYEYYEDGLDARGKVRVLNFWKIPILTKILTKNWNFRGKNQNVSSVIIILPKNGNVLETQ